MRLYLQTLYFRSASSQSLLEVPYAMGRGRAICGLVR